MIFDIVMEFRPHPEIGAVGGKSRIINVPIQCDISM